MPTPPPDRYRLTITVRTYDGKRPNRAIHSRVLTGDPITVRREADALWLQIAADRHLPATRLGIELTRLSVAFV